jgi:hypothetical protein
MTVPLKFIEPTSDQARGVVVEGIEKAREHSRGCASTAFIVDDCP